MSFASSPTLGPDGRLANPVALDNGHAVPGEPDSCQSAMNPGGASPRPQETPGTYYWQVWRLCTGCPTSYETGPVLRFTLGSSARPVLKLPARSVRRLSGDRDGERRRVGGRQRGDGRALPAGPWSRVAGDTLVGDQAEITVSLPKGSQRVRVTATVGSQTLASPEVKRTVRGAGARRTRLTSGSYRGTTGPGTRSASFRVAGRTTARLQGLRPYAVPSLPPASSRRRSAPLRLRGSGWRPTAVSSGWRRLRSDTAIRVRGGWSAPSYGRPGRALGGHLQRQHVVPRSPRLASAPWSVKMTIFTVKTVSATQFKAQCLALLDEAAAGGEIVVTDRGRPVALVVAAEPPADLRRA